MWFSLCESVLKGQNTAESLASGRDIFKKNKGSYLKLFILISLLSFFLWGIGILSGIVLIGMDLFVFVQKTLERDFPPFFQVLSTPFYRIISAIFSFFSLPYLSVIDILFYLRVTSYNSSETLFPTNDLLHQLPQSLS
jgi:hypothetical protein